jgi:hypothetical protein
MIQMIPCPTDSSGLSEVAQWLPLKFERLEDASDLGAVGESVRARRVAGRPILRNPSTSKQSSAHA